MKNTLTASSKGQLRILDTDGTALLTRDYVETSFNGLNLLIVDFQMDDLYGFSVSTFGCGNEEEINLASDIGRVALLKATEIPNVELSNSSIALENYVVLSGSLEILNMYPGFIEHEIGHFMDKNIENETSEEKELYADKFVSRENIPSLISALELFGKFSPSEEYADESGKRIKALKERM